MTLTLQNKTGKEAWLNGYAQKTQRVYQNGFDLFLEFMNQTEEGEWDDHRLLEEREEDVATRTFAFEQKLIEFYEWLRTYDPDRAKKFSDNTRKSYLRAIRSFFAFHRLDVKFTKQQRNKIGKKAKPKLKYYDYTLEDIKAMASVSKPKERYVLLVGKELGLRGSDFIALKQGTFMAHLNEELPISLGEIYTIKEGVKAKPFLGHDGKQAVEQWFTVLKAKGRYDPDKPMLEVGEKELTRMLQTLTDRANINTGNERVRFHQLRVFLITRLSKVLETNRWKQIVGKTVPESAYVKPFQLRDDYRKVLPLITVNTEGSMPQTREIQNIRKDVEELSYIKHQQDQRIEQLEKEVSALQGAIKNFQEVFRGKILLGRHGWRFKLNPITTKKDGERRLVVGEAAYFCPHCGEQNELPIGEKCQKCGKKLPGEP